MLTSNCWLYPLIDTPSSTHRLVFKHVWTAQWIQLDQDHTLSAKRYILQELKETSLRHFLWYMSDLYLQLNSLNIFMYFSWMVKIFLANKCCTAVKDHKTSVTPELTLKRQESQNIFSKYKLFGSEIRYFYYCWPKPSINLRVVVPFEQMEKTN